MFSRLIKFKHELTRDMLSNLNQAGAVKSDWSPQTICKVILNIRNFTLHTFWPSLLRKLSSGGQSHSQYLFSTLCLNNASKVNQSSCNSILCKPYLFALEGGEARLYWARLYRARRGWGPQPDNTSLPLISLKSPMCRKASYLLNGLSIVWLYKGKINLNSSSSSNAFSLESGTQIELDSKTSGIHTCKLILMFDNEMKINLSGSPISFWVY